MPEAPRLYLDEMLYRAKTGIEDPDAALCEGPRGTVNTGGRERRGDVSAVARAEKLC